MTALRTFPAEPASVSEARRFVGGEVPWLGGEALEVLLLGTSELASNSVRHARSAFTVTVERRGPCVRVTVVDHGEGEPVVQNPDLHTPHGRGLQIVDRLSSAWGTRRLPDGARQVWFEVQGDDDSSGPDRSGTA